MTRFTYNPSEKDRVSRLSSNQVMFLAAVAWDDPANPVAAQACRQWFDRRIRAEVVSQGAYIVLGLLILAYNYWVFLPLLSQIENLAISLTLTFLNTGFSLIILLLALRSRWLSHSRLHRLLLLAADHAQDAANQPDSTLPRRRCAFSINWAGRTFKDAYRGRLLALEPRRERKFKTALADRGAQALWRHIGAAVTGSPDDFLDIRDDFGRAMLRLAADEWISIEELGHTRSWQTANEQGYPDVASAHLRPTSAPIIAALSVVAALISVAAKLIP